MKRWLRLLLLAWLSALPGSSGTRLSVDPVIAHPIRIDAAPLIEPLIETAPELRFVRGWALTSPDHDFGGLSALLIDGRDFLALSDRGLFVRFTLGEDGRFSRASVAPLPKGCALGNLKTDRDSESMTRDLATGRIWIGFEWRNAICRADPTLAHAEALANPPQMQFWEHTTGPESLLRLRDGRFLAIEERPTDGSFAGPALLFPGDPTLWGAKAKALIYNLPHPYFRPTDAAELPDGRLLVLHRNFKPPFSFSGKLAILDPIPTEPPPALQGRTIASFKRPGLTDNFEGVAVTQENGRTFIWLVSDDNYLWLQHTYLLQFELMAGEPRPSARR